MCHTTRLMSNVIIPVHLVLPSYSVYDLGRRAIQRNMELIGGPNYNKVLPESKSLVVIMIDGIAIGE